MVKRSENFNKEKLQVPNGNHWAEAYNYNEKQKQKQKQP